MRKPRNQFNVGVRFESHAYSIVSLKDVDLSPADVLSELEEFCARIRRDLAAKAVNAFTPDQAKALVSEK